MALFKSLIPSLEGAMAPFRPETGVNRSGSAARIVADR